MGSVSLAIEGPDYTLGRFKKNRQRFAPWRFCRACSRSGSALGELLCAAGATQTDLLALDFTRIARHETGLAQRGLSEAS
jgi:hypothetical protein